MLEQRSDCVVLYGGESGEREVSLRSGAAMAKALESVGRACLLFDWQPERLSELLSLRPQCVLIALHGGSGEDGRLQASLDLAGIAFTGARMRSAALCMDKVVSKWLVAEKKAAAVPALVSLSVTAAKAALADPHFDWPNFLQKLGLPFVVKPARSGSSLGVSIVKDFNALEAAILKASTDADEVLMFEQYIEGHELTVALLNGKALGVCEIVVAQGFYDYEAKYLRNDTQYLLPSTLGADFDRELCLQAEKVAQSLDCCQGVARVDFLTDLDHRPYFLEVNTVPGMTEKSLVPKIAAAAGLSFPELCCQILDSAR